MSTALTMWQIEENLEALLDTVDLAEDEEQRFAVLDEVAATTSQGIEKRDNTIRLLRRLGFILDTDRKKGVIGSIDREIDRLKAVKEHFESRREAIERRLVGIISRFGVQHGKGNKRLDGSIGVLTLAKNPASVDITDEAAIPERFMVPPPPPPPPRPDKDAIKRAIQAGEEVPGADIRYGEYRLVVK